MIARILLAVDDTADFLAAARLAVDLAATLGSRLRAVHASTDHLLDAALQQAAGTRTGPPPDVADRRQRAQAAVLSRVAALAGESGVTAETAVVAGTPGPAILRAARDWDADLVVVGRAGRAARGEPYVGSQTRHVLEFCDRPVLVVPPPAARSPR